jgi:hypothetical protein
MRAFSGLAASFVVAFLASGNAGCTSLFVSNPPVEAELSSAPVTKYCPLGVPSTRVRIADTRDGVDLFFSTSMSGVDELRTRVRNQAKANGPNRHVGQGHDGHHSGAHNHGLQLWSMGDLRTTTVEETPNGARVSVVPTDPGRRAEVRKLVIERVAHLEAQGCHD